MTFKDGDLVREVYTNDVGVILRIMKESYEGEENPDDMLVVKRLSNSVEGVYGWPRKNCEKFEGRIGINNELY